MRGPGAVVFAIVLISSFLAPVNGVDVTSTAFKCSACRAIADSLADKLSKEKPRNHLDVRHRLDKDGNRYGKVIEFGQSELRVIELLEDICTSVKGSHELAVAAPVSDNATTLDETVVAADMNRGEMFWAKKPVNGRQGRGVSKHQGDAERRLLENFCAGFIEAHEEEITAKILRGGSSDAGTFSDLLCGDGIGRHCTAAAGEDSWLQVEESDEDEGKAAKGEGDQSDEGEAAVHVEL